MRLSLHLVSMAAAVLLSSGCQSIKKFEEAQEQKRLQEFADAAKKAPPVPSDSAGKYPAGVELDVLDALLQKYPGRQTTRTVVEIKTVTLPPKIIVSPPVVIRADTVRNRSERDSLLFEMERLTRAEQAPVMPVLRAELARLRSRLLVAFNRRGCLPDTTIFFPKDSITFSIKRLDDTRYMFTYAMSARHFKYDATTNVIENNRVAQDMRDYWQFWQFKALAAGTLAMLAFSGWLVINQARRRV